MFFLQKTNLDDIMEMTKHYDFKCIYLTKNVFIKVYSLTRG